MLSVAFTIMLNVIMLSIVMLSVVMLSVAAPFKVFFFTLNETTEYFTKLRD